MNRSLDVEFECEDKLLRPLAKAFVPVVDIRLVWKACRNYPIPLVRAEVVSRVGGMPRASDD